MSQYNAEIAVGELRHFSTVQDLRFDRFNERLVQLLHNTR